MADRPKCLAEANGRSFWTSHAGDAADDEIGYTEVAGRI